MSDSSLTPLTSEEPSPPVTPLRQSIATLPTTPEGCPTRPGIPLEVQMDLWSCWQELDSWPEDGTAVPEFQIQTSLSILFFSLFPTIGRPPYCEAPIQARSRFLVTSQHKYAKASCPNSHTGKVDIGISAVEPTARRGRYQPEDLIGVIEVKSRPGNDSLKAALVNDVDVQVRDRANDWAWHFQGRSAPRLILMGFVASLFRPYLWESSSTEPSSRNKHGYFPGIIRPSDADIRMSSSRLCPALNPRCGGTWKKIRASWSFNKW